MNLSLFVKKTKYSNFYLYSPKTINQEKYLNYLNNDTNKIIISTGPAGTGKTLLACQKAIMQLKSEELDKIIITRPIVTIEEDIGFLPGSINKKMDPWTKPIFDIFIEYYSKTEIDMFLNNGKIEICPLVFMRGRTFKNSFIIADEMQNSSPNQMQMLVTRLGINSRMVITGDLNQTDIKKENGLNDFMNKVEYYNNTELIKIIRFHNEDIERSEIVKKVIEIYNFKKPIENIISKKNNIIKVNESSLKPNYTVYNKCITNTNTNKISNDNDAALIPKHHMTNIAHKTNTPHITHNYDIFFEPRDF
jgi:phosphate starvation-inducible PhoH-like protein